MANESIYSRALQGHFYAVGVGPGPPDLLTCRAARLVETADVIIAPRSAVAKTSLALDTVRHLIAPRQEVLDHQYAMKQSETAATANWAPMAELAIDRCLHEKSVVQITLGDPMIYSTTCYLLPLVLERLDAGHVHVVPGIGAFQAAASLFAEPLTIQNDRLMLMPATDLAAVELALGQCETLVLYKCAKVLKPLAALLEKHGLAGVARMVCYAGQGGRQTIHETLSDAIAPRHDYLATVIVHIGRKPWNTATE
ncbi:MAG: precorrin-2 C(20)-methyltransferase [Verrucomicrobiota bacterium]|nr:precorrin-2 C(20)-methyltransferase [Verrucomicrobiota bacterium]